MKKKIIIGLISIAIIAPLVLEGLTILKSPNINSVEQAKENKGNIEETSKVVNKKALDEIKYLNLNLKKVANRFQNLPYEYELKDSVDERGITHYYGESKDKSKGNMILKFYGKNNNLSEIHFQIFPEQNAKDNTRRAKQIEKTLKGLTSMAFKNHDEVNSWIENAGGKVSKTGQAMSMTAENKKITLSANQLSQSLNLDIIGE